MELHKLADLYKVDRRALYKAAKSGLWGAHKENGVWYFDSPPLDDQTISVEAIAKAIRCSKEIVRRWCRESAKAAAEGRPVKIRAVQVGRTWRIHFEDGARLILAQLGGYRNNGTNNSN